MVNQVFWCKNKIKKQLKTTGICLIIAFVILLLGAIGQIDLFMGIGIFGGLFAIMGFLILLAINIRKSIISFATTADGRIFQIVSSNNGTNLMVAGQAIGNTVGSVGGIVGTIFMVSRISKVAQTMSNPEIIANILYNATSVTGVIINEITNVKQYKETKGAIQISCEVCIINDQFKKKNQTINISKDYIGFDNLKQLIISKNKNV